MQLQPGLRLESATCDTQVVVVRAPKDGADVDLRCGGAPLRPLGAGGERQAATEGGDGTLVGKRYANEVAGVELLCTHAGVGTLTLGDEPLTVKGAKPLPSSD